MKSAGFHLKSTRFHADFMKSDGFQSKDPLARNCNPMLVLVNSQMYQSWCHEILVTAPEMQERILFF